MLVKVQIHMIRNSQSSLSNWDSDRKNTQSNTTAIRDLIRSRLAYMKKKAVMTRPIARVNTDNVGYIATAIGLAIGLAA